MSKNRLKIDGPRRYGSLFCCVHFSDPGPTGSRRHGNVADGWIVYYDGSAVSPVFRKLRLAQEWAEENYSIGGWEEMKSGAYRQVYAIPTDQEDK